LDGERQEKKLLRKEEVFSVEERQRVEKELSGVGDER